MEGAYLSETESNERNPYLAQLEDQVRSTGIKPVTSIHDLACDVFESDEELAEFLTDLYASRRADMG